MLSSAISVSVSPSRPRLAASFVMRIVNALLSIIGAMKSAIAWSSWSDGAETLARPQSSHSLPDSSLPVNRSSLVLRSPM